MKKGNRLHHQGREQKGFGDDGKVLVQEGRKRLFETGFRGVPVVAFESGKPIGQGLGRSASVKFEPEVSQIVDSALVEEDLSGFQVLPVVMEKGLEKLAALGLGERGNDFGFRTVIVSDPGAGRTRALDVLPGVFFIAVEELFDELSKRRGGAVFQKGLGLAVGKDFGDVQDERTDDDGGRDVFGHHAVAKFDLAPQSVSDEQTCNPRFNEGRIRILERWCLSSRSHFCDLLACR